MITTLEDAPAAVSRSDLLRQIADLKKARNAVILAHNYELPEVQDVADYVGDSLFLAREAARSRAEVIVFCGVHFMAETAAILCPGQKVLLPDLNAGCSLADSITVEQLVAWKQAHPGAVVVSYVNTSAAVKAESDYCVTSSNAVAVVRSIPAGREILFLPDMYLGSHVAEATGRKMHIWMGECHVHAGINPAALDAVSRLHPGAELLIHPECGCSTPALWAAGDRKSRAGQRVITSTDGMLRYVSSSPSREVIVATELGIIHRMRQLNPEKEFVPASRTAICPYMKMITLEKIHTALRTLSPQITVEPDIARRAIVPIERMLEVAATAA